MRKNSKDIYGDGHGFVAVPIGRNVVKIEKKVVETIDLTPTWENVAGVIEVTLLHGNADGRAIGRLELHRMAQIADRYVALDKIAKERGYQNAEDALRALCDHER